MAYSTAEYKLNSYWTLTGGFGHAERPPTQTELLLDFRRILMTQRLSVE